MRRGMTFFMDDEMHRRLKVAVAVRGTNMANILNQAVVDYVNETEAMMIQNPKPSWRKGGKK